MEGLEGKCGWCLGSELYERYHDQEWGKPQHDEQRMFEFLLLETFQAGLSWILLELCEWRAHLQPMAKLKGIAREYTAGRTDF